MVNAKIIGLFAITSLLCAAPAWAASTKYTITGKVKNGSGYQLLLIQKNGNTLRKTLSTSGAFKLSNLTKAKLSGATLQLVNDGRYFGPVVLAGKSSKVSVSFSGKDTASTIALGQIVLKDGYAKLKKLLSSSLAKAITKASVNAVAGKPTGASNLGLQAASNSSAFKVSKLAISASDEAQPGADSDRDGVPDTIDADDDGDGIMDAVDADSESLDIPMTSLNLDFRRSLNAHVRDGLSDTYIDAAIGGENMFALSLFYSLPTGSSIDGGYVICPDSLSYCRRNTPTGYYGGLSESTTEFRNHPWSELLNSDGYPRMELVTIGGSSQSIVASIQPRVGRSEFQPGDILQAVLTSGSSVVSTKTLSVAPYFVSIPAIKEYDAGSGTTVVDYTSLSPSSGSIPGASPGDPIVLSGAGELSITFWRPQRAAVRSDESGYYDMGNLNYGLIIDSLQATCAGYYSNVSSDLEVDATPLGEGDSPLANQGANLTPYADTQADRAVDIANTLSFKVNLKDCLANAGGSPGTFSVTLQASGAEVRGGRITASQGIYVTIP